MIQTLQEIIILGGISCLGILWIAALIGMMQVGWNTITSPVIDRLKEKKE
tara:strand:- start:887 stop:1036 length:150 start_codon:yes stop_codon:yes gene_type:complete